MTVSIITWKVENHGFSSNFEKLIHTPGLFAFHKFLEANAWPLPW